MWKISTLLCTIYVVLSKQCCLAKQVPLDAFAPTQFLNFDDIDTDHADMGFGQVPNNYSFLDFGGLIAAIAPTRMEGLLDKKDFCCATSKPNSLYGTRTPFFTATEQQPGVLWELRDPPHIALTQLANASAGDPTSFELLAFKIKPLNSTIGTDITMRVRGHTSSNDTVDWKVDWPGGFNDMLKVDLAEYSKHLWTNLTKVEFWAETHYAHVWPDWDFCLDDLEIKLERA